jgi:8-oxo-dGTP diphosphatase
MQRPLVGIGVLIVDQDRILLGKRISSHGSGSWGPPGGHLEFGESFFECAQRETFEETGLIISDLHIGPTVNNIFPDTHKQYVSVFVIARKYEGTLLLKEPHKCEQWLWYSWNDLPNPLFIPLVELKNQQYTV